MSNTLISVFGLGMSYAPPRFVLKDITFQVQKGEFVILTGPNGAGKTTLLKLLYAVEKPTCGLMNVFNRDITKLRNRELFYIRSQIGFVFQDFKLLPQDTLYDNITLPLVRNKLSKKEILFRVEGVLSLVGLLERKNELAKNLSGGEQQRIAIARAIINQPQLLLADEPTGNLDRQTSIDIMRLFDEIHSLGTTVVLATHDESIIERKKTRILCLESGYLRKDSLHKVDGGVNFFRDNTPHQIRERYA